MQAGPCVWKRATAEGLALATCLGKLNIAVLELLFLEAPPQRGSAGHIHDCQTELKLHLRTTRSRSRVACVTAPCSLAISRAATVRPHAIPTECTLSTGFPISILSETLFSMHFQQKIKKSTLFLVTCTFEVCTRKAHGSRRGGRRFQ